MYTRSTKSNANRSTTFFHRLNGCLILCVLISTSACTNDYVSVNSFETPQPTSPSLPTDLPTVVATLPQETPVAPIYTPTPQEVVGIGGGDADYEPTSNEQDQNTSVAAPELPTAQPTVAFKILAAASNEPPTLYYTQAGDTLPGLAARFQVDVSQIVPAGPVTQTGFLDPNQLFMIPKQSLETSSNLKLIPDSEIVFSPSGLDFDIEAFTKEAGGYLSTYREYLHSSGWLNGAGVIKKIAVENSINPRVLLSILEYKSHWVYGFPTNDIDRDYPLGKVDPRNKGLYAQLAWAMDQLNVGYYGWREGITTSIVFDNQDTILGAPELNAGTFALQYLFAKLFDRSSWEAAMYTEAGFAATHNKMFGNSWLRAMTVEPLFPATLQQPSLILPFEEGIEWSFSGGPHAAWGSESARAALDFAPDHYNGGCSESKDWVVAMASGIVVRTGNGVVVLDLDGDGIEQTGWDIMYMHISSKDRVQVGDFLEQGQRIGHPSCEGGVSTGTHTHIARKFNGEWILAGGPLPFDMDGWIAHAAALAYKGTLTNGDITITACACGTQETVISRGNPDSTGTTEPTPQK